MAIQSLAGPDDILMKVPGVGSPLCIITGTPSDTDLHRAAAITARYSDAKHRAVVDVVVFTTDNKRYTLTVTPADSSMLNACRIHPPEQTKKKKKRRSDNRVPVTVS